MAQSPKSKRTPPPRNINDYVLTREVSKTAGLTSVADDKFTYVLKLPYMGAGVDTQQIDIGFDFNFDGLTYKKIIVSTSGFVVLIDPADTDPSWNETAIFADTPISGRRFISFVKTSTGFSKNHVLITPWCSSDLFVDYRYNSQLQGIYKNLGDYDAAEYGLWMQGRPPLFSTHVINGKDTVANFWASYEYSFDFNKLTKYNLGCRYFLEKNSTTGNRLIIRWVGATMNHPAEYGSGSPQIGSIIEFEAILYENGNIEFRYCPQTRIQKFYQLVEENFDLYSNGLSTLNLAMMGIVSYKPNTFRDFSFGLGYRDSERQQFKNGGVVYDAAYTESESIEGGSNSFTFHLDPYLHWPGRGNNGTIYKFSPPQYLTKTLPKKSIRDQAKRYVFLETENTEFNDQSSIAFKNGTVSYPSLLTRYHTPDIKTSNHHQSMFYSGSIELTGSVIKGISDTFVYDKIEPKIKPFDEFNLYEQNQTSEFYVSGTKLDDVPWFNSSLASKKQIKISLQSRWPITMQGATSSIYYYNNANKTWLMPRNAFSASYISISGSTFNTKLDDSADLTASITYNVIPEDHRGFDPVGNPISSGSTTIALHTQTTPVFNSVITAFNDISLPLQESYAKSIQTSPSYSPTSAESLKYNIDKPFLIEKAVIEIPMKFGHKWFSDKTKMLRPFDMNFTLGTQTYVNDFGGPGITVALYNKMSRIVDAERNVVETTLDLIATGTITHEFDDIASINVSNYNGPGIAPGAVSASFSPLGFRAFGGVPSVVISGTLSGSGYVHTGSVIVPMVAAVSNGVTVQRVINALTSSASNTNNINAMTREMLSEYVNIFDGNTKIRQVNPFGRSASGFSPSGRSIFGREHITSQDIVSKNGLVRNPLYAGEKYSDFAQSIRDTLETTGSFAGITLSAIPLGKNIVSPYLVFPGDELVIAISKTRPACFSTAQSSSYPYYFDNSSNEGHHVQLASGTIGITLYGCEVKENKEFIDNEDNTKYSDQIHAIMVGNEPVVDQFDVPYRSEFFGGMFDDYITGSLVSKSTNSQGLPTLTLGSRGRVFSKFYAREKPTPDESTYELSVDNTKSFRAQSWFERVGIINAPIGLMSQVERFYDSCMPNAGKCFEANGANVVLTPTFGSFDNTHFLYFNRYTWGNGQDTLWNANNDKIWSRAYPFESRYSNITRDLDIKSEFSVKYASTSGAAPRKLNYELKTTTILPLLVGYDIYIPQGTSTTHSVTSSFDGGDVGRTRLNVKYVIDYNINETLVTDLSQKDTAKWIYGFGDYNNMQYNVYSGTWPGDTSLWASDATPLPEYGTFGSNHFPYQYQEDHVLGDGYGVLIRGWKYGVSSGLPQYSKSYFKRNSYGQFRDQLEQALFTKFYDENTKQVVDGPVQVKFVTSYDNTTTLPENTWSSNLSHEVTSSVPYFDGVARNRNDININTLNKSVVRLNEQAFGNTTI